MMLFAIPYSLFVTAGRHQERELIRMKADERRITADGVVEFFENTGDPWGFLLFQTSSSSTLRSCGLNEQFPIYNRGAFT